MGTDRKGGTKRMCKRTVKELCLKREDVLYQVEYLMRVSNVNPESLGSELLKIAILENLHDSSLTIEELIERAKNQSPISIDNSNTAGLLMQEALVNVHTKHHEKVHKANAVEKYISNVSDEIRMKKLIQIRKDIENLDCKEDEVELFIAVAMRRKMKPQNTFDEVLNHVAGRRGYEEIEDLINDLHKVVKNEGKSEISNDSKKVEIEDLVRTLLNQRLNVIF